MAEILQKNLVCLLGDLKARKNAVKVFRILIKPQGSIFSHLDKYLHFFPGFGVQKSIVQRTARETI